MHPSFRLKIHFKCIVTKGVTMRVVSSLKSLKNRDPKNNRLVRRKGVLFVINKKNPKMKCRQG